MADHNEVAYTTADGNDYPAHEQTYEGFIMLVKYGTAAVVLIVRDGRSFVPDETTRLMRGDQALLVSARRSRAEAERRLRAVSRAGRLASWRGEQGAPTEID